MKITHPMSPKEAQDRTNAAMAPPDPMTTSLTPEGLADLGAADLEETRPEPEPKEPETGNDPDPKPPNPYRPHKE